MQVVYNKCPLTISTNSVRTFIDNKIANTVHHGTKTPTAIIMIGGPGSGKTSAKLACVKSLGFSLSNFINIDPDEIIASLFKVNYDCKKPMHNVLNKLFYKSWRGKYNIIIDKTGKDFKETYKKFINFLKERGYNIYLCINVLDYSTAVSRINKRNRSCDTKRQCATAKKTYKKLKNIYGKYVNLHCKDADGVFVYDNKKKLKLIYKSFCDSNGKKHIRCYSASKLPFFLRKVCSHKNKYTRKLNKYTRKLNKSHS